jgi:transcriptional regulator with PAS, ATPase and Fis domain
VLFLDEIGELELPLQAKLLRVLQERRVLGVGAEHEVAINVRVIIATHRDLPAMVEQGTFRADLYHRLNVLTLELPPLRARREEIKPLCEHFVTKWCALAPAGQSAISADLIAALQQLPLPGNVRELENLVRRALINRRDATPLGLRDLPPEVWQQLATTVNDTPHINAASPRADLDEHLAALLDEAGWSLEQSLDHCEKLLLRSALRRTRGNQAQTAQLLKITPRSVYNKMQKHQLPR